MSFDFSNINPIQKAQATYKDGGGLGGGGMYMRQGKKQKKDNDDIFESTKDEKAEDIVFETEPDETEISQDTLFNRFVNWFRICKK